MKNSTSIQKVEIAQAAMAGKIAFEKGLQRVPSLDSTLDTLLVGKKFDEMFSIIYAWVKGWDSANLA